MLAEEKDELFEEEPMEAEAPEDEFREKIETPDAEMMADMDAPEMTRDELDEITEEHAIPGD